MRENLRVGCGSQADDRCVDGIVTESRQERHRLGRHGHVDQELHATANSIVSSSARLAAKRSASSISAVSRYGYDFKISAGVCFSASRPRSLETGNRRSRMQGFPVQTSARTVIRGNCMRRDYTSSPAGPGAGVGRMRRDFERDSSHSSCAVARVAEAKAPFPERDPAIDRDPVSPNSV